jgi:very-short-patch-repair endonuclease
MTVLYNRIQQTALRREQRANQTKAEAILWNELRNKQLFGFKFRRQHGVGPYIVDFYCPKKRLAIEVDGGSHYTEEGELHDRIREEYISSFNIVTLRFDNDEVYYNIDGVIEEIMSYLDADEDN